MVLWSNPRFRLPLAGSFLHTCWFLQHLFWVISQLWSAATADLTLFSKVAVKIWWWFCSPQGGRSPPPPAHVGGFFGARSVDDKWGESTAASQPRRRNEALSEKVPLGDQSGPVGLIHVTRHQQHYQLSFVLIKTKTQLGKTGRGGAPTLESQSVSAPPSFAHEPVQATGSGWTALMIFPDSSHTHAGALLVQHMASFASLLPALHVLPDVSQKSGSLLIRSNRRIPRPPIGSLLCCVAAVAGRRHGQCFKLHNKTERIQKSVLVSCFGDQSSSPFYSRSLGFPSVCCHLAGPVEATSEAVVSWTRCGLQENTVRMYELAHVVCTLVHKQRHQPAMFTTMLYHV